MSLWFIIHVQSVLIFVLLVHAFIKIIVFRILIFDLAPSLFSEKVASLIMFMNMPIEPI